MSNTSVLDAARTTASRLSYQKIRVSDADANRFEQMFAGKVSTRDAHTVYMRLSTDEDRLRFYRWLVVNRLFSPADIGESIVSSAKRINKQFLVSCEAARQPRLRYAHRQAEQQ